MARGYIHNVIEIAPARFICPRRLSNAPKLETIAEEEYKSGQLLIDKKLGRKLDNMSSCISDIIGIRVADSKLLSKRSVMLQLVVVELNLSLDF
ncbi:hypothetical protein H5410_041073 [Solanum commersonii]|uniref:Uncharacterized protein n=1 Tax=Solanum commersonii TaxID=4109 RepID=A0A9J5XSM5_SOLCO|nr:hypothetical protein H5410_041073 [Solanum commersonii]